jgi:hypothetical protein
VDVAADDGLDVTGCGLRRSAGRMAAGRAQGAQRFLHVPQVLHEQNQIAFDQRVAGFRHREHVVVARVRHGLPQLLPRTGGGADREAPVAHEERPALHALDPSFDHAHQVLGVVALDEEARGEEAAATDQIGVGVHELGQAFEHGRHHSR